MSSNRTTPVVLAASSARTTSGNGDSFKILGPTSGHFDGMAFVLDVTAAATGGAKRHFLKILASGSLTAFENGTALSAGSARNLFGQDWRASWAITDASTDNASFTFSVVAIPQ